MKLRQKLAAVLAASMIVTAVPVVTMAATTNSINCDIKVRDGSKLGYSKADLVVNPGQHQTTVSAITVNNTSASNYENRSIPNLELFPKDTHNAGTKGETFFVELEDGKFNFAAFLTAWENQNTFNQVSQLGNGTLRVYEKEGIAYGYNTADIVVNADGVNTIALADVYSYGQSAEDKVKNRLTLRYTVGAQNITNPTYAEFTLTSDKQMRVDVYGTWNAASRAHNGDAVLVPLFVDAESTQVKVKIDGADSFVTTETKTIGVANEEGKEVTITADDAKTAIPVDGGEISKLIVTEEVLSAIEDSENRQIKLELPTSSDLEWKTSGITATGKRAFAGSAKDSQGNPVATTDVKVNAQYGVSGRNKSDKQVLIIELPDWCDANARGVIELEGLTVRPTEDVAQTGELSIKVSAVNDDDFTKEKSLTVGVVTEYGVSLTCEKPATVKAGRSAIVNKYSIEAVLAENVKDSIVTGRDIKFTLENGYIIGAADILEWVEEENYVFGTQNVSNWSSLTDSQKLDYLLGLLTTNTSSTVTSSPKSSAYKQAALAAIQHLVSTEDIKFSEDGKHAVITDVEVNKDGQVIGFTVYGDSIADTTKKDDERFDDAQKDKLKVKLPVATSLQSTGEVTLTASGRAFAELGSEEKISCKIADIVEPIKVDMTAAELKVGLQSQTTGSIVINETDKGMIQRGTIIVDANPQEESGIKFQSVPKVEATNLKLGDVELSADKRFLYIEVEKTSTEAGKISITDATFTTDRTVPEGSFPVRFYGSALTDEAVKTYDDVAYDKYVVEDFIRITTPNTEDIKNGALKAVTSSFSLNSNKYTVDGVEYEMDAQAYSEDGRTMVPVRYIAQAFGIDNANVLYANQVATIIAGEKIIQLKMGSNILTVNGAQIQMDTKAVVKDGRAYVPMKFIAAALGVSVSYDDATKTATFSNKN